MAYYRTVQAKWPDGVSVSISRRGEPKPQKLLPVTSFGPVDVTGEVSPDSAPPILQLEVDAEGIFKPLRIYEESDYQLVVALPFPLSEAQARYEKANRASWPFANRGIADAVRILPPHLWLPDSAGSGTLVPAFFNAGSYAGSVDLSVLDELHSLHLEVMSAKIGYADEYKALVESIASHHLHLIHQLQSLATGTLSTSNLSNDALLTAVFHLRRLMRATELPAAVERVLSSPAQRLLAEEKRAFVGNSGYVNPSLLASRMGSLSFKQGGPFSKLFGGCTPEFLPIQVKRETFDIEENRYVKAFLEGLEHLLDGVRDSCRRHKLERFGQEVDEWKELVSGWLAETFWREIGQLRVFSGNSQLLIRAPGYRDVLRADTELHLALSLPWGDPERAANPAVAGNMRPVHRLYEYWCYFEIRSILEGLYGPDVTRGRNLVIEGSDGLAVRLGSSGDGSAAQFKASSQSGAADVFLFYQRRFLPVADSEWGTFSGSYSVRFDPDIAIAVRANGKTHWLIFDAKYKLERLSWLDSTASELSTDEERESIDFNRQDLDKMHAYRDAILGTRGAYILFPGRPGDLEQPIPFVRKTPVPIRGCDVPSVGAFRLRPGSASNQRPAIAAFLEEVIKRIIAATDYDEELGLRGFKKAVL